VILSIYLFISNLISIVYCISPGPDLAGGRPGAPGGRPGPSGVFGISERNWLSN